jgi:hypothetical protein
MITFAKAHKVALGIEFIVIALLVLAMPVAGYFGRGLSGESGGWLLFFCALPWSLAAAAVPAFIGVVILAVGLGINAVIATIVIGSAISWWLKTLRY